MYQKISKEIESKKKLGKAEVFARFFKTGAGQYGEGDQFLGLSVPEQRQIAQKYSDLDFETLERLFASAWHEYRLTGLLVLVIQYAKGDQLAKKAIYGFYLKNLSQVNNWDLVDLTAYKILGAYLFDSPKNERKILYKLVLSKNLWERRVAMIACFHFIKNNEFEDAVKIAEILLADKEDLMHKAVGWMLREIGKRDQVVLKNFLNKYASTMPRTMLRYAIEKFDATMRKKYMEMRTKS